jgi:Zinc finger C-x8-C-x5-C-x3-H type (and similar)/RNA-binding, Nab2-type zinc finger
MYSDTEEGEVIETPQLPAKRQREPKEKTSKCKYWEQGACQKGKNCKFLHKGEINVKNELCKYFLTGCCMKGTICGYSHDLSKFPCKYYHGIGLCNSGDSCKFSHIRLTPQEIPKFIKDNEAYLIKVQKVKGNTNLGEFFTCYLKQKEFEKGVKAKENGVNDARVSINI